MKVYLINPPPSKGVPMVREGRCMQRKGAWTTVWPPVTLATMAAMLLRQAIEVKLNDCTVDSTDFTALKKNIAEFKPDLLVINTATASIDSDLMCARLAKETDAQIKTLAFGLHVTVLAEEVFLQEPSLDYVIRGEPEFCLLEVVKALEHSLSLEAIKGLSYRDKISIRHNVDRGFDDDLNTLPFPDWQFINTRNYLLPLSNEPFLLVTTSKGCPHSCIFCPAKPFYGSRLRLREPKIIVDEMQYVKGRFGVSNFLIWSESFTEQRSHVVELCEEIIGRQLGVSWVANSRVDKVDPSLLALMKRAGCWMIGYGVESASQAVLDASAKNIKVVQIEQAVQWAKQAGLQVTAHVIFGLPGETLKTGEHTIQWLKKLPVDFAQIYCAVPWPSTPLYRIAKEKNWIVTDNWELFEQNYSVLDIKSIAPKQVEYLRRKAMREFYLYPGRFFKLLGKIIREGKVVFFLKAAKEFLSWL